MFYFTEKEFLSNVRELAAIQVVIKELEDRCDRNSPTKDLAHLEGRINKIEDHMLSECALLEGRVSTLEALAPKYDIDYDMVIKSDPDANKGTIKVPVYRVRFTWADGDTTKFHRWETRGTAGEIMASMISHLKDGPIQVMEVIE